MRTSDPEHLFLPDNFKVYVGANNSVSNVPRRRIQ